MTHDFKKYFRPNQHAPQRLSWNLWWQFGPWQQRAPAIEATLEAANAA